MIDVNGGILHKGGHHIEAGAGDAVELAHAQHRHLLPLGRHPKSGGQQKPRRHCGHHRGQRQPGQRGAKHHGEPQQEHDQGEQKHAHPRGLIGLQLGAGHRAAGIGLGRGVVTVFPQTELHKAPPRMLRCRPAAAIAPNSAAAAPAPECPGAERPARGTAG